MNHGQTDGGQGETNGEAPALGATLRTAAPFARARLLSNAIRERLCDRLGLMPSEVEEGSRFIDLGIDSLVAVEMQTYLVTETGVPLKSTVIFDYPTIGKLVTYILERMDGNLAKATPAPAIEPQPTNVMTQQDPTDVAASLQNELQKIQALLDGGSND